MTKAISLSFSIKSLSLNALLDFNWLKNSIDSSKFDLPIPLQPRTIALCSFRSIPKLLWFRKFLIFKLFKKIFLVHSFIKLAKFRLFRFSLKKLKIKGHVAQLDRASDSGSDSRGFESLHARKIILKFISHDSYAIWI